MGNVVFDEILNSSAVRRGIARVNTVINSKQRQNLREFYKKKQYLPLDLRVKKTRAIRRKLTKVSSSNSVSISWMESAGRNFAWEGKCRPENQRGEGGKKEKLLMDVVSYVNTARVVPGYRAPAQEVDPLPQAGLCHQSVILSVLQVCPSIDGTDDPFSLRAISQRHKKRIGSTLLAC